MEPLLDFGRATVQSMAPSSPNDDGNLGTATTSCTAEDQAEPANENSDADDDVVESVSWEVIKGGLDLKDPRVREYLRLFEEAYGIDSSAAVLAMAKQFLGCYLVREFDYRAFCRATGTANAHVLDDEDRWREHIVTALSGDLTVACTLMLRLAMSVARAHSLGMADWKDVNEACGCAIMAVPACYRLQRGLPGGLNDARALRLLAVPSVDVEGGLGDLNPWKSEEGKALFERHHDMDWSDVAAFTSQDGKVRAAFSGVFEVLEITQMEGLAIASLKAERIGSPPELAPEKEGLAPGSIVLWELEGRWGQLLQMGFVIEAEWYEMDTDICFMTSLTSISPVWAKT